MNRPVLKLLSQNDDLMSSANKFQAIEAPPPLPEKLSEIHGAYLLDVVDWDELFHAIKCRLSTAVATGHQSPDKIKATVLECVEALDQLHQALTLERQQRRQPLSPAV